MTPIKVHITGLGTMGEAILRALSARGRYDISVSDKNAAKRDKASAYGAKADEHLENLNSADIVIIAVKPQDFESLSAEVKGHFSDRATLVSIAAGVTISKIQKLFGAARVVRAMPNIGLSIGAGITAWTSSNLSEEEKGKIKKLLDDLSENFEVSSEDILNSITAISGSGPAYFFFLAQALEKAAIKFGITEKDAERLVRKTFSAAAALQRGKNYDELIKEVASKGGTTEAALKSLESQGFPDAVEKAVRAAEARAKELS